MAVKTLDGWKLMTQPDLWRALIFTVPRLRHDASRFVGEKYVEALAKADALQTEILAEFERRLEKEEPRVLSCNQPAPPKEQVCIKV